MNQVLDIANRTQRTNLLKESFHVIIAFVHTYIRRSCALREQSRASVKTSFTVTCVGGVVNTALRLPPQSQIYMQHSGVV